MSNKKKNNVRFNNSVKRVSPRGSNKAPNRRKIPASIAGLVIGLIVMSVVVIIILSNQPQATAQTPASTPVGGVTPAGQATPAAQTPEATSAIKQWSTSPAMTIDKTKQYTATVTMAKGGQFVIQLYPDKAPITVNSFVFLARQGFYNGVTFHRVLNNFMAQGGDPTGSGSGGPGYSFVNEDSDLTFDKPGVVAMANAGRDTNGSQFFITFVPVAQLNGGYTIFGQVTSGMDVVNGITRRDPQTNPAFKGDVIQTITIDEK
jgi:cyclophilin family peptidyl-prolyl cis-trans isomerase